MSKPPDTLVAVVEIGSNSAKASVADLRRKPLKVADTISVVTRLREGMQDGKELDEKSKQRTLAGLEKIAEFLKKHNAPVRAAVATNALRDGNGEGLLDEISQRFGW